MIWKSESGDTNGVISDVLVEAESYKESLAKMQEEGNWSLIPNLLLWMIKDKLDIFDNIRLAAVCRDWQSASACNPKKLQSIGDGFPWIMQWSKDFESSGREFVSFLRTDRFTVDLPEFCEGSALFSKQGWILVQKKNFSESKERLPDSLFLINFFTKSKIKMPDPDALRSGGFYCGSFSVLDGYPNCVVLLDPNCCRQVTVAVAYPGDEAWTKHSYLGQKMFLRGGLCVLVARQDVYCFDWRANMIAYNMSSHIWKETPMPDDYENQRLPNYVVEHEGKIVKFVPDDHYVSSCTFFRYNGIDAAWERLSLGDVKDTSWFLSRNRRFSTKDKGLKVYFLRPNLQYMECAIHSHDVLVHDLMDGSTQTLQLSYPLDRSAAWVDIG